MLSVGELFVGMSHGVVPGGTDLVCLEISMDLVVSSFMEELPFQYMMGFNTLLSTLLSHSLTCIGRLACCYMDRIII